MRSAAIGLLMPGLFLAGCNMQDADMTGTSAKGQGRYAGIGTFGVDSLWEQMAGVAEPKDPAAARPADDTQIIVVIDSHSGEVRQCGNNSGYCVTMKPWGSPGAPNAAPVLLKKHASDLAAEAERNAEAAEPAAKDSAPSR
ncbi:hypothetical protein [Sphingomonas sp.]|uniref:hypothetical protein n=1 Tax=Sphingomonas sp. TaxID=28214 RepID=UPI0025ECB231|nr:hypothetical protein [Sphingomonas sp.]